MSRTIAMIAALPAELKPLVSPARGVRWERLKANKGTVLWELEEKGIRWIAGCSGMGVARAAVALAEMERYAGVDAICSVGWAGGLDATMNVASVWHVAQVVDTQTGERFETAGDGRAHARWPVLATTARVAGMSEKARLAESYGARLVDMEAAALARLARAKEIPFYCMKAVSDDVGAKLPDMNPFILGNGQLNMAPFLAHVAVRPGSWRGLMRLGKNSDLAARHLADAIRVWMQDVALEEMKG